MGWRDRFSSATAGTLKVLQKKRSFWGSGGLPLEKAEKVDKALVDGIKKLENALGSNEKTELVELQIALQRHNQRAILLEGVKRDLAHMSANVEVEEKVTNQLLRLRNFVTENRMLWLRDWNQTKAHIASIKSRRGTQKDLEATRKFMKAQETQLRQASQLLKLSQNPAVSSIDGVEGDKYRRQQEEVQKLIDKLEGAIIDLQALKRDQKYPTNIWAENVREAWDGMKKLTTDDVSLPNINKIEQSGDVKKMKRLFDEELRAIEAALLQMKKQADLFAAVGIEIIPDGEKRGLSRGLSFLLRATE